MGEETPSSASCSTNSHGHYTRHGTERQPQLSSRLIFGGLSVPPTMQRMDSLLGKRASWSPRERMDSLSSDSSADSDYDREIVTGDDAANCVPQPSATLATPAMMRQL